MKPTLHALFAAALVLQQQAALSTERIALRVDPASLRHRDGPVTPLMTVIRATATAPRIDGRLDDPIWALGAPEKLAEHCLTKVPTETQDLPRSVSIFLRTGRPRVAYEESALSPPMTLRARGELWAAQWRRMLGVAGEQLD